MRASCLILALPPERFRPHPERVPAPSAPCFYPLTSTKSLYFIRAGSFVSIPALIATPLVFVMLFIAKMATKLVGVFPAVTVFRYARQEGTYYTLMMSTGLTFGTISALFGLNHGIITSDQYSHVVPTVIGSAVIPTLIANAFFMPVHLRPREEARPTVGRVLREAGSDSG